MSRSYRHPVYKDKQHKADKRRSNKTLRKYLKTLTTGFKSSLFKKKIFEPWNICDWKWYPDDKESISKAKRK